MIGLLNAELKRKKAKEGEVREREKKKPAKQQLTKFNLRSNTKFTRVKKRNSASNTAERNEHFD